MRTCVIPKVEIVGAAGYELERVFMQYIEPHYHNRTGNGSVFFYFMSSMWKWNDNVVPDYILSNALRNSGNILTPHKMINIVGDLIIPADLENASDTVLSLSESSNSIVKRGSPVRNVYFRLPKDIVRQFIVPIMIRRGFYGDQPSVYRVIRPLKYDEEGVKYDEHEELDYDTFEELHKIVRRIEHSNQFSLYDEARMAYGLFTLEMVQTTDKLYLVRVRRELKHFGCDYALRVLDWIYNEGFDRAYKEWIN
jgi:hypothetical protein